MELVKEDNCNKDLQIKAVCSLISNWSLDDKQNLFDAMISTSNIFCIYNASSHSLNKIQKFNYRARIFYQWMSRYFFPEMSNVFTHEDFDLAFKYYNFFVSEGKYFERIDIEIHISKCKDGYFNAPIRDKWNDILDEYSPQDIFIVGKRFNMSFYSFLCNIRNANVENIDVLLYLLDFKEGTITIYQKIEEIIGRPLDFGFGPPLDFGIKEYFKGMNMDINVE